MHFASFSFAASKQKLRATLENMKYDLHLLKCKTSKGSYWAPIVFVPFSFLLTFLFANLPLWRFRLAAQFILFLHSRQFFLSSAPWLTFFLLWTNTNSTTLALYSANCWSKLYHAAFRALTLQLKSTIRQRPSRSLHKQKDTWKKQKRSQTPVIVALQWAFLEVLLFKRLRVSGLILLRSLPH